MNKEPKIFLCIRIRLEGHKKTLYKRTTIIGKIFQWIFGERYSYECQEPKDILLFRDPEIKSEDAHCVVSNMRRISAKDGFNYYIRDWDYEHGFFVGNITKHLSLNYDGHHKIYPSEKEVKDTIKEYVNRGWNLDVAKFKSNKE